MFFIIMFLRIQSEKKRGGEGGRGKMIKLNLPCLKVESDDSKAMNWPAQLEMHKM